MPIQSVNKKDFIALYKDAGWWKEEYEQDHVFIDCIPKKSFCFVGAFDGKRMIGMGRAISDACSDAYIQDVTVLKTYRGKKIGTRIIQTILEYLKKNNIEWIGIVAEPGAEHLYEKIGFKPLKNFVAMKYDYDNN